MYGQVLGLSSTVSGVAGVALLPNTGSTRILFIASATLLIVGIFTLAISSVITLKQRRTAKA